MTKKVTELKPIDKAIAVYKDSGITLKGLKEFKKAEKLECKNTEDRKILGKWRKDAKSIISKVDRKRKDNNKSYQEVNNAHAGIIEHELVKSRDIFDTKIKEYDSVALEKKAKKDLEKKKAAGLVQYYMDGLIVDCDSGQDYNLTSDEIMGFLTNLRDVEISAVDFGEKTEDAEILLKAGIENTQAKFDSRIKFEKEQAEQARIKEEQEAKAKELEEKEDKLKKDQEAQAKIEREKQAKIDKKADEDAEKLRLANKKLKDDRLALEKEKDDIAAKNKADEEAKQAEIQFNKDHGSALAEHEEYKTFIDQEISMLLEDAETRFVADGKERKAQAKKDKKYAKEIKADKKTLSGMITVMSDFVSSFAPISDGGYKTEAGEQIELELIKDLKAVIGKADLACKEL